MRWVLRIGVVVVLLVIGAAGIYGLSQFSPRDIPQPPETPPAEQAPHVPPPAVGAQWRYTAPRVGAGGAQACTKAAVDVSIEGGEPSAVMLCLRRGGGYPQSASIALVDTKGRFACTDCQVRARFDGAAARTLAGSTASSDGTAYTIFFQDPAGLAAELRRASTLTVTLPVRGAGDQTASFDVAGLKWSG